MSAEMNIVESANCGPALFFFFFFFFFFEPGCAPQAVLAD